MHGNLIAPKTAPASLVLQKRLESLAISLDALPKRISRGPTWQLAIIAALAGAASVLAMAPFFLWPVLFISMPVMVWLLDAIRFRDDRPAIFPIARIKREVPRAFLVGWAFGFGYFVPGIYWIGYAFMVDPEKYALLMPFAVAALPAGLAIFYGLAAALAILMWQKGFARIAAFAFAFFLAEAARGNILTGFPWNLFGQALATSDESRQIAAYIGVYGLTLAAFLIFPSPATIISIKEARSGRSLSPLIASGLLIIASFAFGAYRLQENAGEVAGLRMRIVQPNIPQKDKWKPENRRAIFDRELELTRKGASGEDIANFTHILWPESSVPFLFMFNDEIYSREAKEMLAAAIPEHTAMLIGGERAEGQVLEGGRVLFERAFNSLFVINHGARIDRVYDKVHLVPFGEYVPLSNLLEWLGLRALSHRVEGFQAGKEKNPAIVAGKAPAFSPLICYEIIFPGEVTGDIRPGWLVNLTNDAWFGDSTGPHQHLHQAQLRATEEGLPVMRAANTGISAVIDPFGRILAKLDLGKTGVIDHALPHALPQTFYGKMRSAIFIALFLFPLLVYLTSIASIHER